MATVTDLMGLGIPAEAARRLGTVVVDVATTDSTQNSAGGLLKGYGNKNVIANIAGANGAVTLPSEAALGDVIIVYNTTGNTGRVYPPTGGTMNQGTANQYAPLAANASLRCERITATSWRVMGAAAIVPA